MTLGTPFLSSRLEAGVIADRSGFFPPVVPLTFFGGGVTTSLSVTGALSAGDLKAGERAAEAEIFGTLSDAADAIFGLAKPLDSSRLADGRGRLLSEILQKLWKSFNRRLNRNLTIRDF